MVDAMAKDNLDSEMFRIGELSQLMHVHPNTIRRWHQKGLIKAYRLGPRGDRRFKKEDIIPLLSAETEINR